MIKFPAIRTADDLEAFEQSFSISFDAMELRAALFHIIDAYRERDGVAIWPNSTPGPDTMPEDA